MNNSKGINLIDSFLKIFLLEIVYKIYSLILNNYMKTE